MINLGGWSAFFNEFNLINKIEQILDKLEKEEYYPSKENIFRAIQAVPPEKVKIVIIGQDPYHEEGQANGFAFAVNKGVRTPPSLINIFKEIKHEYGQMPTDTTLIDWANQGVLLLNTTLTVSKGNANSHAKIGWKDITNGIIKILNSMPQHIVYLLWGNSAIQFKQVLNNPKQIVLTTSHPSPLSVHRGFLGCDHFKKANEYLKKHGLKEITWVRF